MMPAAMRGTEARKNVEIPLPAGSDSRRTRARRRWPRPASREADDVEEQRRARVGEDRRRCRATRARRAAADSCASCGATARCSPSQRPRAVWSAWWIIAAAWCTSYWRRNQASSLPSTRRQSRLRGRRRNGIMSRPRRMRGARAIARSTSLSRSSNGESSTLEGAVLLVEAHVFEPAVEGALGEPHQAAVHRRLARRSPSCRRSRPRRDRPRDRPGRRCRRRRRRGSRPARGDPSARTGCGTRACAGGTPPSGCPDPRRRCGPRRSARRSARAATTSS